MMTFVAEKRNASTGAGYGHKRSVDARQRLIYERENCATFAREANRSCIANDKFRSEV